MRKAPPNGTRVGLNLFESQAASFENIGIGLCHLVVGVLGVFFISVKAVSVLHHEFPSAHDAESGPDFIAELGLNLVQQNGELAIGFDFPSHDIRDDLLMGGAVTELASMPVFNAQ